MKKALQNSVKINITMEDDLIISCINCAEIGNKSLHSDIQYDENLLLIVFRGTQNMEDLILDLDFDVEEIKNLSIHKGFYTRTEAEMEKILNHLETIQNVPIKKLIVTGHSLGGACAIIFSLLLSQKEDIWNKFEKKVVITFGAPLVSSKVVDIIDYKIINIVNVYDLVPRLLGQNKTVSKLISILFPTFDLKNKLDIYKPIGDFYALNKTGLYQISKEDVDDYLSSIVLYDLLPKFSWESINDFVKELPKLFVNKHAISYYHSLMSTPK